MNGLTLERCRLIASELPMTWGQVQEYLPKALEENDWLLDWAGRAHTTEVAEWFWSWWLDSMEDR